MRIRVLTLKILTLTAGLLAASTTAASPLRSGCSATPAQALETSSAQQTQSLHGFRVSALRWDPLLRQQWALIVSCERPELPPLTLAVPNGHMFAGARKLSLPTVRAGDVVRAWSQEELVRIEMTGVVEGTAALGDRVRVRVRVQRPLPGSGDGTHIANAEVFSGVVRGAHEVQIYP